MVNAICPRNVIREGWASKQKNYRIGRLVRVVSLNELLNRIPWRL